MGRIVDFLFKKASLEGRGASYNVSTGVIKHPPKGQGKVKVTSKTKTTKTPKGK